MLSRAETGAHSATGDGILERAANLLRWGIDRTLSIAYGTVYDYIFDRFPPYQMLQRDVLATVEAGIPAGASRSDVRVLETGCGPGNFSCILAEAGFSVLGIDPYSGLIDLAREKQRARHLARLAFQIGDLGPNHRLWEATFDQVVSIHALYTHPSPHGMLVAAHRILKPGGHLVVVNHTRRVDLSSAFREVKPREGAMPAVRSLMWIVPNAIFETARKRVGPHYWNEETFADELQQAGFTVLEMRRTFLSESSLLVWARKNTTDR